jgi:poly(A) polymerase
VALGRHPDAYDRLVLAAGAITEDFGVPGVAEHAFGLKSLAEATTLRNEVLRRFEAASARTRPGRRRHAHLRRRRRWPDRRRARRRARRARRPRRPTGPPDRSTSPRCASCWSSHATGCWRVLARSARPRSTGCATRRRRPARGRDRPRPRRPRRAHRRRGAPDPAGGLGRRRRRVTARRDARGRARSGTADPGRRAPAGAGAATCSPSVTSRRRRPRRGPAAAGRPGRDAAGPARRRAPRRRAAGSDDPREFRYRDKGIDGDDRPGRAVAELPGGIRLRGLVAWLAWLLLHLLMLVGFRNRVAVLFSWIWNYATYDHSARLILDQREAATAETARGADPAQLGLLSPTTRTRGGSTPRWPGLASQPVSQAPREPSPCLPDLLTRDRPRPVPRPGRPARAARRRAPRGPRARRALRRRRPRALPRRRDGPRHPAGRRRPAEARGHRPRLRDLGTPEETERLVRPWATAVWLTGAEFGTVSCQREQPGRPTRRIEITTFRSDEYRPARGTPRSRFGDSHRGRPRPARPHRQRDGGPGADFAFVDPFGGLATSTPGAAHADRPAHVVRRRPAADGAPRPVRVGARRRGRRGGRGRGDRDGRRARHRLGRAHPRRAGQARLRGPPAGASSCWCARGWPATSCPSSPSCATAATRCTATRTSTATPSRWSRTRWRSRTDGPGRRAAARRAAARHRQARHQGDPRDGTVTFHHHDVVGGRMTRHRLRELRFDKETIKDVDRAGQAAPAVPHLRDGLDRLGRAPLRPRRRPPARAAQRPHPRRRHHRQPAQGRPHPARVDELEERIAELREQEELEAMRPPIDGNRSWRTSGSIPGPLVGEAWHHLLELRIEHGPMTEEEALAHARRVVGRAGRRPGRRRRAVRVRRRRPSGRERAAGELARPRRPPGRGPAPVPGPTPRRSTSRSATSRARTTAATRSRRAPPRRWRAPALVDLGPGRGCSTSAAATPATCARSRATGRRRGRGRRLARAGRGRATRAAAAGLVGLDLGSATPAAPGVDSSATRRAPSTSRGRCARARSGPRRQRPGRRRGPRRRGAVRRDRRRDPLPRAVRRPPPRAGDAFDPVHLVHHQVSEVRGPDHARRRFDLWTASYTVRDAVGW